MNNSPEDSGASEGLEGCSPLLTPDSSDGGAPISEFWLPEPEFEISLGPSRFYHLFVELAERPSTPSRQGDTAHSGESSPVPAQTADHDLTEYVELPSPPVPAPIADHDLTEYVEPPSSPVPAPTADHDLTEYVELPSSPVPAPTADHDLEEYVELSSSASSAGSFQTNQSSSDTHLRDAELEDPFDGIEDLHLIDLPLVDINAIIAWFEDRLQTKQQKCARLEQALESGLSLSETNFSKLWRVKDAVRTTESALEYAYRLREVVMLTEEWDEA